MRETILKLRTILPAEQFIVTGSFALAEYGLMDFSVVRDLDIILIKPGIYTIECINRFMKDFPAPTTKNVKMLEIPKPEEEADIRHLKDVTNKEDGKKKKARDDYDDWDEEEEEVIELHKSKLGRAATKQTKSETLSIFMYDKIKVDIYIREDFNEPTLLINGLHYATIQHIIVAKQSYGRIKDWLQCREMARKIFNPDVFEKELNRDWKGMLREGDS